MGHPVVYLANTPLQAALYGMSQSIPDKGLVEEMSALFLDALYSTKG